MVALVAAAGCTADVGSGPGATTAGAGGTSVNTAGTTGSSGGGSSNGGGAQASDVGVVPAGRLNRTQYANTVRDLLGTSLKPASSFPADDLVLGFDVIAGVLRVQPEHIEKYLAAGDALVGELLARPATDPLRARYISCDLASGAPCVTEVTRKLATAAWRRPVSDAELAPYVAAAQAQSSAEAGLSVALRAVLTSAKFLFRWELDPSPDDATPHLVSGFEMASRLSYAITSSTPDAELLAAAADGRLQTADGVLAQTKRLLSGPTGLDPLIDGFAAQWLNVNQVDAVVPNAVAFPSFDAALRASLIGETKAVVRDFWSNDLPVSRLFDADFTYVDARLAQHYGLSGVSGTGFQRVPTAGTTRGGLLTLGSFLTSTSNPTRTSPVKRGFYVLDRLLCSAPPPPPGDVDLNIDAGSGFETLSVRQRAAKHLEKGTSCFACHKVMDPIGLGLENYDAIGAYRQADAFGPIDATGTLPTETGEVAFNGARELAAQLAADARTLPCVVSKLMTFTLGRELRDPQEGFKLAIASATQQNGGHLRAAIEAIVVSDLFRMRRAATAAEVMP